MLTKISAALALASSPGQEAKQRGRDQQDGGYGGSDEGRPQALVLRLGAGRDVLVPHLARRHPEADAEDTVQDGEVGAPLPDAAGRVASDAELGNQAQDRVEDDEGAEDEPEDLAWVVRGALLPARDADSCKTED